MPERAWEWLVQSGASSVGSEWAARKMTRTHYLGNWTGLAANAGGLAPTAELRQLQRNLERVLQDDRAKGLSFANVKWYNALAVATTVMAFCATQIRKRYWPPKKLSSKKVITSMIRATHLKVRETQKPHTPPNDAVEVIHNGNYQEARVLIEDLLNRLQAEVHAVNNATPRKRQVLQAIRDDVDKVEEELLHALGRWTGITPQERGVANEIDNNINARRGANGADDDWGLGPLGAQGPGPAQAAPADRSGSIVEQVFAAHAMRRALERAQ